MPDSPVGGRPRLYRNGSVYSAADPFATAMLVDGDTVAWVGSEQAASSLADSSMEVVDLDGALVTPGFVDSHVHITETGVALSSLDLSGAASLAQVLDLVAGAAARTSGTILGHGWDETRWPEGRPPTAEELDRASGGIAVFLSRVDVHSAVVSWSLADRLDLATMDGWLGKGQVVRDAHRRAAEAAHSFPPEERGSYQLAALRHAASRGYVALAEMGAPHVAPPEDLRMLVRWDSEGETAGRLPRVLPYWGQLVGSTEEARSLLAGLGAGVLGLAGDLNIDGSIGSRTALLRTPYADAPAEHGTRYLTVEQVTAHLAATSELGIQAGFHVIGDAGMDIAVEGLKAAAGQVGADKVRAAGHRLEHAEMADAGTIAALKEFAVTVSVQPMFDAAWGGTDGLYGKRLGTERGPALNPVADYFAAGVPVCFGSDSPVTPLTPWASVRACVMHRTPAQRISARAAFLGHTRAGWRAARSRNPMEGQLVPGAPASFAVWEVEQLMVQVADERVQSWSTDPRARTPLLPALDTGTDPRCLQTVRDGVELYRSSDF
ncbi:amidohydrolase [Paenarthrobacter sp. DKR-5]|uniref:amidohydrolase n=1 Tax=Paenarthrobacter sp. DKR-5 TaxID=2835535 RepID=UPI0027DE86F9|nr:amidohydrolase [Paenarthrobacter sp. DKR-5]